jgi:hypothetical protein
MKPIADRRSAERYDVVGALWGQLELTESARICNVSVTGALLDSPRPAALDASQEVRLVVDGLEVTVDAHVRHVHRLETDAGTARYLIGVEFASPPLSVVQSIEELAADAPGGSGESIQ